MALMNCFECGKQISDKATSCPNCGAPIEHGEKRMNESKSHTKVIRAGAKWEGIGFVLILVGIIIAIATKSILGGVLALIGFIVFIIGRFL